MEPGAAPSEPLQRFRSLVEGDPAAVALDQASLALAEVLTGGVDVDATMRRLDELAVGVTDFGQLTERVFTVEGFRGACPPTPDPSLSFLDRVIERRTGLPILMGIVLIEVGRRAGLAVEPVNLPLHFIVADGARPDVYLDPCTGTAMSPEQVKVFLAHWSSGRVAWSDRHLRAVPARHVVIRTLTNLQSVYQTRRDPLRLALVAAMRASIPELAQEQASAVRLGAVFN